MEPFVTHRGRVALLDWSDVNTDLIIPARYLKKVERTGFGPLLFADKRYVPGGAPTAEQPDEHGEEVAGVSLERSRTGGCDGSGRGAQLRLRLEPRACGLGGDAGGLSCRHCTGPQDRVCGYLRVECACRTACSRSSWTNPTGKRSPRRQRRNPGGAEVTIDLREQTVTLHSHSVRLPPSRTRAGFASRSRKRNATACCTGWTRSARRCFMTRPSPGTSRACQRGSRRES